MQHSESSDCLEKPCTKIEIIVEIFLEGNQFKILTIRHKTNICQNGKKFEDIRFVQTDSYTVKFVTFDTNEIRWKNIFWRIILTKATAEKCKQSVEFIITTWDVPETILLINTLTNHVFVSDSRHCHTEYTWIHRDFEHFHADFNLMHLWVFKILHIMSSLKVKNENVLLKTKSWCDVLTSYSKSLAKILFFFFSFFVLFLSMCCTECSNVVRSMFNTFPAHSKRYFRMSISVYSVRIRTLWISHNKLNISFGIRHLDIYENEN